VEYSAWPTLCSRSPAGFARGPGLGDRSPNVGNVEGALGRTSKSKSKSKTKTTKRQRIKDLSPKDDKQVKGGTVSNFSFTQKVDKASPVLF